MHIMFPKCFPDSPQCADNQFSLAAAQAAVEAGRYGGTYANKDIAFEFAMWISPEFKVYLIREFQRLKEEEQKQLGWTAKRELSKINYRIHTDAIKQNLIPDEVTAAQASIMRYSCAYMAPI